jgi:hypothetical protein
MASVYKPTGRKVYLMKFIDQHGQPQIRSSAMKDEKCALSLAELVERDAERIRAGRQPSEPAITGPFLGLVTAGGRKWEEATTAYLAELARQGSDPKELHYRECKRILKQIADACKWTCLAEAQADSFSRYLADLAAKGRAPRTQNRHHETLRAFLNYCVRQHWLPSNPIGTLKMARMGAKGRRRLRRAYTIEEWQRLFEKTSKAGLHTDRTPAPLARPGRGNEERPGGRSSHAARMC